jgi:transcriptional antiterminator NusG
MINQTGEAPEPDSTEPEAGTGSPQPDAPETVSDAAPPADVGAERPPALASDTVEPEPEKPMAEDSAEEPPSERPVSAPAPQVSPTEGPKPGESVEEPETEGRAESEKLADDQQKPEEPKSANMDWYILKVQSNREDSIREALWRRIKIAGMEQYFGDVIVPIEMVTEFKGGKRRVSKRKLYPGYLVVQMEINDDTWFLVRETPGIGDFTGAAGAPTPMLPHEVERVLAKKEEKQDEAPKLKIGFRTGDRVKINEGTFENFEGEVDTIDETSGRVTVMINIFGRSTPVELEYWQVEAV